MFNYFDNDSDEEFGDILVQIFFNKYHCIKKLGQISFGQILKLYIKKKNML